MPITTVDAKAYWNKALEEHLRVAEMGASTLAWGFETLLEQCETALLAGGKLLLFGNGGSAADSQHIAAELVVRFAQRRRAMAAIALTTDTSVLTAAGNDLGFDQIFARQIAALARPLDMVIALSTSGRSPNVLLGLREGRNIGCKTACLTGSRGIDSPDLADLVIAVPSESTARIQEMHILIGHALCDALEQRLITLSANSGQ